MMISCTSSTGIYTGSEMKGSRQISITEVQRSIELNLVYYYNSVQENIRTPFCSFLTDSDSILTHIDISSMVSGYSIFLV